MRFNGGGLVFPILHQQWWPHSTWLNSLSMKVWTLRFVFLITSSWFCTLIVLSLLTARKNFHTFESEKEERSALIYNYNPVHSPPNSDFEQKYIFWCLCAWCFSFVSSVWIIELIDLAFAAHSIELSVLQIFWFEISLNIV